MRKNERSPATTTEPRNLNTSVYFYHPIEQVVFRRGFHSQSIVLSWSPRAAGWPQRQRASAVGGTRHIVRPCGGSSPMVRVFLFSKFLLVGVLFVLVEVCFQAIGVLRLWLYFRFAARVVWTLYLFMFIFYYSSNRSSGCGSFVLRNNCGDFCFNIVSVIYV